MVNDFTNINKTNNRLSPSLTEHKNLTTYVVENTGPGLGQVHKCDRVKSCRISPKGDWKCTLNELEMTDISCLLCDFSKSPDKYFHNK